MVTNMNYLELYLETMFIIYSCIIVNWNWKYSSSPQQTSHVEPVVSLQPEQQAEELAPESHSSASSTTPLPHNCVVASSKHRLDFADKTCN